MHFLITDMPPTSGDSHPFAISSALDYDFGYTLEFLSGAVTWNSLAASGGGRHPAASTLDKMRELCVLTRDGASIDDRQTVLASCWHQHYDAARIDFICRFLIGDDYIKSPKLNKTESVKMLVERNAPFIPFTILNEHLKRGLIKFGGKLVFPAVDWATCYAKFCKDVPFDSNALNESPSQMKNAKLALAVDYWKEAMSSHNMGAPAGKSLSLSDEEVAKLSGSQFSFSEHGTPKFHKPAPPNEQALRAKLLAASASMTAKRDKIRQAEELERQAADLRDSLSVASHASPGKRKSEEEDESHHDDQGTHALDIFLTTTKRKVECAEYIDFASMSASRLKEIKMLNCTSSKSSKIAAGLVLRHSLSEADVLILSDDFTQITDGFLFHYLKVVSESNLPDPLATIIDRLGWWQWMCHVFGTNFAAQVKFIKNFLVEHHGEPFWTPLVKLETNLVILCKEQAPLPVSQKMVKKNHSGKAAGKGGGKTGNGNRPPRVVLSASQLKKIESWKTRFPNVCTSRMIRGRICGKEKTGGICKYLHTCAWCGSANCKADCAQAETL